MKKLVVVESPSKAKTINKYLGKDYKVIASKGHVVDLPKSELGVDEESFDPKYVVTKKKALTDLKKAYKDSNELILAVDLDREGEAIAWHIAQKLGAVTKNGNPKKGQDVKRIVFSEISKDALEDAMEHPRKIDMDLVDAQQARRVLDRLVGYKLSPLLWKKIQFGLSAGRVQSVAVRLIVEREEERNEFKPDEYWSIQVPIKLKKGKGINTDIILSETETPKFEDADFVMSLDKIKGKKAELAKQKDVDVIVDSVKSAEWLITKILEKESKRNPKAPLITSTLQRLAVNRYGFTARRTMSAAQKLYEHGHITYMRTDSTHMSPTAVKQARKYVEKEFGKEYVSKEVRAFSSKQSAQEAHECIRPVNFAIKSSDIDKLKDDEKKVYNLIWGHALASQMSSARVKNITVTSIIKNDYEFKSTGSQVVFPGFLKATKEKVSETMFPEIKEGQDIYPQTIAGLQHFTKPPARYTEASLIKKLEDLGIGRPSTYASIIHTIQSRKYVEKDGRSLFPTDMGTVVNALLTKYFDDVVDYNFTAEMEEHLDKVAEGKGDWKKMIKEFYVPFESNIKKREKTITRDEFKVLGDAPKNVKCPVCKSKMVIKLGKYGRFYSCAKFPDCDGMRSMDGKTAEDVLNEPKTKEFKETYQPAPKTDDDRDYLLKEGRYGRFWAHPDYPKVKDARPLQYTREKLVELYGEPPKTDDGKDFLLRKGRYGEFWAHPDYPKKKKIIKIAKKDKEEKS